jgi:peptidoglycan/LPS O-acetylase OafA/YrhL
VSGPARRVGGTVDWRVAGRGALVALVVALPPVVLVRLLKGSDLDGRESNLWVVSVLAILLGFGLAGFVAGRQRPRSALLHAAAAAGIAFAGLVVYTLGRHAVSGDPITVAFVVRLLLVGQITISLGILGGFVATRRRKVSE